MNFEIHIERVLQEKLPNKKVPSFLVWLLKKIIHQDWMNRFLSSYTNEDGVQFSKDVMGYLNSKMECFGLEKLPKDEQFIFVSNHPLGGLDGVSLAGAIGSHFSGVKFLINDLLLYLKPLRSIGIGIKVGGKAKQAKSLSDQVDEVLSSDQQMIMFPAGMCSRYQRGIGIQDLDWKKTFVSKAVQYKRRVVPIYYNGRNSTFFYALAFIRKSLGIKVNIEMLFLVDELYKSQNKTFKAYFGEPIDWQYFDNKEKSPKVLANEIKRLIYSKKENLCQDKSNSIILQ